MKILAFSDIHMRTDFADEIIRKNSDVDKIVLLGDYFDTHGEGEDTPEAALRTAKWLQASLKDPKRIHLLGNHDMPYRFPMNPHGCSGWTRAKAEAVHSVMTEQDWKKMTYIYQADGWVFSHAGLHAALFMDSQGKFDYQKTRADLHRASEDHRVGIPNPLLGVGHARGGDNPVGGVNWCDLHQEFEPIPGVNQVFGHTAGREPRAIAGGENPEVDGYNVCIDAMMTHYAIIDDGEMKIEKLRDHDTPSHKDEDPYEYENEDPFADENNDLTREDDKFFASTGDENEDEKAQMFI